MTDVEPVSETPGNLNSNSISQMFDRIAPTYDILNHLLSFGRDFSWRRKLANAVDKNEKLRVLDLATGTGDVLISLLRRNSNIAEAVCLDIPENMLAHCRKKIARYLDKSIENFHSADDFYSIMRKAGFSNVNIALLTFGVACLYQGTMSKG